MKLRAVALVIVLSSAARANPAELFGFTPRASSLAGAEAGLADDLGAAFYNPSGMIGRTRTEIGAGLAVALPALHIDRALPQSAMPSATQESSLYGELGAVIPVGGWFAGKLYLGGAVMVPVDKLLRIENLDPDKPQFLLWQSKPQRFSITMNAAVRLAPGLSLGAGLAIAQQQNGYYKFGLDIADRRVTVRETHVDASLAPALNLGVTWDASPAWRVGLVWRGETLQRTDVPTSFDLGSLGALQIQTASNSFYWPNVIALGASHRRGAWLLTAQLELQLWSRAPTDAAQFAIVPSGDVLVNLGLSDLIGFAAPARPAGLQSILVPRFGAEWQATSRVALRGGVALKPAITPEESGATSYLDSFTTTLAAGCGVTFPGLGEVLPEPLIVDFAVTASLAAERQMKKSAAADPVGDASFGGAIWSLSAMLRYAY